MKPVFLLNRSATSIQTKNSPTVNALYRILYLYSLVLNSIIDRDRSFIQPVFNRLNRSATSIQTKKYSPTVYTLYRILYLYLLELNSVLDRYRSLL